MLHKAMLCTETEIDPIKEALTFLISHIYFVIFLEVGGGGVHNCIPKETNSLLIFQRGPYPLSHLDSRIDNLQITCVKFFKTY